MRSGEGFILTYAINSYRTFKEITSFYEQIKTVKEIENFPCVLVG